MRDVEISELKTQLAQLNYKNESLIFKTSNLEKQNIELSHRITERD